MSTPRETRAGSLECIRRTFSVLGVSAALLLVAGCAGAETDARDEQTRWLDCRPEASEPPCGDGARVGVDYDFILYTHCGIQAAVFDGRIWQARRPPKAPGGNWMRGEMRLLTRDIAEFRAGSLVAKFRPDSRADPPPCY